MFANRTEAGRRLAAALVNLPSLAPDARDTLAPERGPIVYALPRGGVPVAAEVAAALHAPLDLILVRKIGVPGWEELALGAVVDGSVPVTVLNDEVVRERRVGRADIETAERTARTELESRRTTYLAGRAPLDPAARTAIVVDDGIATGATARAALRGLRRQKPERIVLAIPVAPSDALETLRDEVDEIVCLETPWPFSAVGAHYRDFGQVSDDEVRKALQRFARPDAATR